jgi:hypothetical protein
MKASAFKFRHIPNLWRNPVSQISVTPSFLSGVAGRGYHPTGSFMYPVHNLFYPLNREEI